MSSWLYNKLRLGTKRAAAIAETPPPPPPPPCTPNRASYYVPSRDRAVPRRLAASRVTIETERRAAERNSPRLRDTRFPQQPQPGDIVLDRQLKPKPPTTAIPPPELRLRPILTRPAGAATTNNDSAAASPTAARFHARAAPPPRRRKKAAGKEDEEGNKKKPARPLRWVYESRCVVVVKESADPEEDFLASVEEMVAANYDAVLRSPRGLDDLLACYLALNAAEHHRAIVAAFRRALDAPALCGVRCMHESS